MMRTIFGAALALLAPFLPESIGADAATRADLVWVVGVIILWMGAGK